MSNEYEIKTYGTAKVMLEQGEYTIKDLIDIIESVDKLNRHNRALIDAVLLSSNPAGLKRQWVGLTDEEELMIGVATGMEGIAIRMIEAKLKEKNT